MVLGKLKGLFSIWTNLTLDEIDFTECPFRIQIHNLPPNRMNLENAIKIGNFIGNFIKSKEESPTFQPQKSIRIQVNVDTRKLDVLSQEKMVTSCG